MRLEIVNSRLFFNGKALDTIIDESTNMSIFRSSICKQDKDISEWVNEISRIENGHLLWCSTWLELRKDDLVGLNFYYYLLELIEYLGKDEDVIEIDIDVDRYIAGFISSLYEGVVLRKKKFRWRNLRERFAPFKLLRGMLMSLKKGKNGVGRSSVWFKMPLNVNVHRYRNLLGEISNDNEIAFFHANHDLDIPSDKRFGSINFANFWKLTDIGRAYVVGRKLRRVVKGLKNKNLLKVYMLNMKWQHFGGMFIRELWVERSFIELRPRAIIFATALAYSPSRLMSRLAKIHNIPYYVSACRNMFIKDRFEERIVYGDLEEINDCRIADGYIVWDEFSRLTLRDQGISEDKIFLIDNIEENRKEHDLVLTDAFLIIFTHDVNQNGSIIRELSTVKPKGNWYYRMHPLVPLEANQIEDLRHVMPGVKDVSTVALKNIEFRNTIVVSVNSTAAVEACSYGAGILWLPYLNYRSLVFYDVIEILGLRARSTNELKEILDLAADVNEMRAVVSSCQKSYIKRFKGISRKEDFMKILKTNK